MPKKVDLQRTPLLKSVCHVGIHVIFSSMYNVLHQTTLGRSVNHHRTRVLLLANQVLTYLGIVRGRGKGWGGWQLKDVGV